MKLDGTTYPSYPAIMAALNAPVFRYNGFLKIVQWTGYEVERIPTVTLDQLGYSKVKMTALKRNYYNTEEADRVRNLLKSRKGMAHTSVAMSMRGGTKDSRSQGWCIESMVISFKREELNVGMLYRSTEVIYKFAADLVFLPWVFDQLEINPARVRFHFANSYLSGIYYPLLFGYWEPLTWLRMLRRVDPKLFFMCRRYLFKMASSPDAQFNYGQQQKMCRYAWRTYPEKMPAIRDYLEKYQDADRA